jgi:hypothetical protein
MARNWFTYDIRPELNDGTLDKPVKTYATQRMSLKVARAMARSLSAGDVARIVVLRRPEHGDRWDDIAIAAFPVREG